MEVRLHDIDVLKMKKVFICAFENVQMTMFSK